MYTYDKLLSEVKSRQEMAARQQLGDLGMHLHTLEVILLRHRLCPCPDADCIPCKKIWPCDDAKTVATALRKMGAVL